MTVGTTKSLGPKLSPEDIEFFGLKIRRKFSDPSLGKLKIGKSLEKQISWKERFSFSNAPTGYRPAIIRSNDAFILNEIIKRLKVDLNTETSLRRCYFRSSRPVGKACIMIHLAGRGELLLRFSRVRDGLLGCDQKIQLDPLCSIKTIRK